jgi:hypothetical protein
MLPISEATLQNWRFKYHHKQQGGENIFFSVFKFDIMAHGGQPDSLKITSRGEKWHTV